MLLVAVEKELSGCIFTSMKRDNLKELLNIEDHFEVLLAIALGKPKEKVVIDEVIDENIKYYREENQIHHVPKRSLEDLILFSKFH